MGVGNIASAFANHTAGTKVPVLDEVLPSLI